MMKTSPDAASRTHTPCSRRRSPGHAEDGVNAEVGFRGIGFGMALIIAPSTALSSARADSSVWPGAGGQIFRHAMDAAGDHGCGKMMRAGDDVGDDFGFGGIRHAWLQHADDHGRASAEANIFADDGGIALHYVGPKAIGEDGGTGCVGAVVVRVEQAAEDRMQAHYIEIRAIHYSGGTSRGSPRPIIVKPIVENSPKEEIVLTLARKSSISGTENAVLSAPMPFALWRM